MPRQYDPILAYVTLYRIRAVELELVRRYPQGQMRNPVHFSIGQEGVAVGVAMALPEGTHYYGGHRNHHWYLACGGNLGKMLKELYGLPGGCWDGHAGSMHLADESAGYMGSFPIVGDSISIATGAALANKLQGHDRIICVAFGDAALETGQFWESLNFAALRQLPILYICENNLYATQTPVHQRQPKVPMVVRVQPFVTALTCQDSPIELWAAVHSLALPAFVEVKTYRFLEHVGPNDDTALGYRTEAEVLAWKARDVIGPARVGCASLADVNRIETALQQEIGSAFAEVEQCLATSVRL